MVIPSWYSALLLAGAAWRTFQLVAHDDILNWPRRKIVRGETAEMFIECVYCAGAWVTLAWWGAWQIWPHGTLIVASLPAIHAVVIGAEKLLSSE